jgi:hypothetical protein
LAGTSTGFGDSVTVGVLFEERVAFVNEDLNDLIFLVLKFFIMVQAGAVRAEIL